MLSEIILVKRSSF